MGGNIQVTENGVVNLKSKYINDNSIQSILNKLARKKPNRENVKILYLDNNQIGRKGATYIRDNPFDNLVTLSLTDNFLGSIGLKYLSNGSFNKLTVLNVKKNKICCEGTRHLSSGVLQSLKSLNISENRIGAEGAIHLTKGHFHNLISLNMRGNPTGTEGIKHLVNAPFENLLQLAICKNNSYLTKQHISRRQVSGVKPNGNQKQEPQYFLLIISQQCMSKIQSKNSIQFNIDEYQSQDNHQKALYIQSKNIKPKKLIQFFFKDQFKSIPIFYF